MISKINRMFVRRYSDSGQKTLSVEWTDHRGKSGRTECALICECCGAPKAMNDDHMRALIARGKFEGLKIEKENW